MSFFTFSYLVLGVSYMTMATYLAWKDPHQQLNRFGALLGCFIAGWAFFSMGTVASKEASMALVWAKLFIACIVFVPFLNLLFIHSFLASTYKVRLSKKLFIASGLLSLLFLASDMTPLLITGVSLRKGNFYFKDPGLLYHMFELYFFFVIVYSAWSLLKVLQISPRGSKEEKQSLVLLITLVISYLSGGMSYLLAHNRVSPLVVSIGNYGAILYSIAVTSVIKMNANR